MVDTATLGQPLDDNTIRTPHDDCSKLISKLVDLISSFQMRPMIHLNSNRYIFSADVHSVFLISADTPLLGWSSMMHRQRRKRRKRSIPALLLSVLI